MNIRQERKALGARDLKRVHRYCQAHPWLPVIIGGGIEAYAMARQFHDSYACPVICLSQSPHQLVVSSDFVCVYYCDALDGPEAVLAPLSDLSDEFPHTRLVLVTNGDQQIANLVELGERIPANYRYCLPAPETLTAVSHKASFKELCERAGVPTPRSQVFGPQSPTYEVDLQFPVVAKPSSSAEFDELDITDKHKVYFFDSSGAVKQFLHRVYRAGYVGDFIVEEYIPGDDTQVHSVTAYVDSSGALTMLCHAHVLLQDHRPDMIGNPVAMITRPDERIFDLVKRFFETVNYRGFANFDVKVDPRDHTPYFFEVNPRLGRNSGYVQGAGLNPMQIYVEDVIGGQRACLKVAEGHCLYTLVPVSVVDRYLINPQLRRELHQLRRRKAVFNPLINRSDKHWKRWGLLAARAALWHRITRQYPPSQL